MTQGNDEALLMLASAERSAQHAEGLSAAVVGMAATILRDPSTTPSAVVPIWRRTAAQLSAAASALELVASRLEERDSKGRAL